MLKVANPQQELNYARNLRQINQLQTRAELAMPETADPLTLKRILTAAKQRPNTENQKNSSAKITGQLATKQALVWSWRLLIPSWGLTVIYLNIHAVLRPIIPNYFSKVGWQYAPIILIDLLLLIILISLITFIILIYQIITSPLDTLGFVNSLKINSWWN